MAATIEEAKANDPAELKRQVADLRQQLSAKPKAEADPAAIERAVADNERKWRAYQTKVERELKQNSDSFGKIAKMADDAMAIEVPEPPANGKPFASPAQPPRAAALRQARAPSSTTWTAPKAALALPVAGGLGKCERAILQVLSQYPEGCLVGKLTLLSGYRYSGGFRNSLASLRTAGLIEGSNDQVIKITDAGLASGEFEPLPTGEELRQFWLTHQSFGQAERDILAVLIEHPEGKTAQELCDATGRQYSGGFRNSLSSLRTAGVIEGKNTGTMTPSPILFE